jgi:hypothetical protein
MDRRTWLACALVVASTGCSAAGKADVTGHVTHQGKPVVAGVITFIGPDSVPMTGSIQPDGTYTVQGVTPGLAKIGVISRDPAEQAALRLERRGKVGKTGAGGTGPAAADPTKWFALPQKYESPDTSEVTTTLHSGANQFDVTLP